MATGPRFYLPLAAVFGSTGVIPGALLNFYITGTNTRANTYANYALTTPNANPVQADASGLFPDIFLDPDTTYKVVLTGPNDGINPPFEYWTADPVTETWNAANTTYFDLPFQFLGGVAPASNEVMGVFAAVRPMQFFANFDGTALGYRKAWGVSLGAPSLGNFTITVNQGTIGSGSPAQVGTITVAQTTGVWSFSTVGSAVVNMAAGDYLELVAQSTVDSTFINPAWTLTGLVTG